MEPKGSDSKSAKKNAKRRATRRRDVGTHLGALGPLGSLASPAPDHHHHQNHPLPPPPRSRPDRPDLDRRRISAAATAPGPQDGGGGFWETGVAVGPAPPRKDAATNSIGDAPGDDSRRAAPPTAGNGVGAGRQNPCIVWLRQDLRLHDNPALHAALLSGKPVVPVFIAPPDSEQGGWAMGGCTKYWLHHSLDLLDASLRERCGSGLVLRLGSALEELLQLIAETGADRVLWNRVYEPWFWERDRFVDEVLTDAGIQTSQHNAVVLFEPELAKPDERPECLRLGFGSVGFFLSACQLLGDVPAPLPTVEGQLLPAPAAGPPASLPLDVLGLAVLPRDSRGGVIDWAAGIREHWVFGEAGATAALDRFLTEGVFHFENPTDRFRADRQYTAAISPYVRFGELSSRSIFHRVREHRGHRFARTFLRRLAWRDLAYWMLWRYPTLADEPFRPWFAQQRWSKDPVLLKRWQRGVTGYPLVDAAMRQLWTMGWMPNYMRHVVAGFLVEFLNMDWREGERWFHDTLVDADVAINAYMWQNGGHSGCDQWNFVMHPVFAAKKCDPDGDYVRRWCPELARLPVEFIHCPWEAPRGTLAGAGVSLRRITWSRSGRHPVVAPGAFPSRCITDLEGARKTSLDAVLEVRRTLGKQNLCADGNEKMVLASGHTAKLITRVDYREDSPVPLTRQTAEAKWDKTRREKKDVVSMTMSSMQGRNIVV